MKKILGIVGSKRSSGNCELMVKEISRQVAAELGRRLFAPASQKTGLSCSLCGGETFRFLDGGRAGTLRVVQ